MFNFFESYVTYYIITLVYLQTRRQNFGSYKHPSSFYFLEIKQIPQKDIWVKPNQEKEKGNLTLLSTYKQKINSQFPSKSKRKYCQYFFYASTPCGVHVFDHL